MTREQRIVETFVELADTMVDDFDAGPCFECFDRGVSVASLDLGAEISRWPIFGPAAVRRGFHSVQAVPMRVRGTTVGALNLFCSESGGIGQRDLPLGQGMADIAAIALLQERSLRESRTVVDQLQGALTSRVVIEQAKGVLAERANISLDGAFARLRSYARSHNRRLSDVAGDLIAGRLEPAALAQPVLSDR